MAARLLTGMALLFPEIAVGISWLGVPREQLVSGLFANHANLAADNTAVSLGSGAGMVTARRPHGD